MWDVKAMNKALGVEYFFYSHKKSNVLKYFFICILVGGK